MQLIELFEDVQRSIPRDVIWTAKSYASSIKAGDYFIAWLDVEKVFRSWQGDESNFVGPGGAGGIKGRYQRFGEFIRTGVPIEVPYIGFNYRGAITFGNGRHRFTWMRDHGAKAFPAVIATEYRDAIKPFLSKLRHTSLTKLDEDVFHGAPHRFSKFSISRVNTGQKAQSQGWGLYFASEAQVAEHYRETLSTDEDGRAISIKLDGRVVSALTPMNELTAEERAAIEIFSNRMNQNAAIASIKDDLAMLSGSKGKPVYQMHLDTLKALKTIDFKGRIEPYRGTFYEVEIPDSDDYLHWDLPITQQPPKVQAALSALGIEIADHPVPFWEDNYYGFLSVGSFLPIMMYREDEIGYAMIRPDGSKTGHIIDHYPDEASVKSAIEKASPRTISSITLKGEDAYWRLAKMLGSPKAASMALRDHGIPGNKYKDQYSRGRADDEATYNYVLFDDEHIRIKSSRDMKY